LLILITSGFVVKVSIYTYTTTIFTLIFMLYDKFIGAVTELSQVLLKYS